MLVNINRKPYQIAVDDVDSPVVVVVSHERSGTHFLMNSIAMNSRYTVEPFLNFDHQTLAHEVNFHSARSVGDFFDGLQQMKVPRGRLFLQSIIKSHHTRAFLEPILGRRNVRVLYVYRHPADTLVSLWRFLHRWDWNEGPQTDTPLALATRAPEGRMVRYQDRHAQTFFDRWAHHVQGWLEAGAQHQNVMCIRYSRLCTDFESGVGEVLAFLNQPLPSVIRPPPRDSYIQGQKRPLTDAQRAELVFHVAVELARHPVLAEALIRS